MLYLQRHPELSLIKGRTSISYNELKPRYFREGLGALNGFYLKGNYVSGIIYNRQILTGEIIDEMDDQFKDFNRAYYWYPHLMWDAYCLQKGSFASSDLLLVEEGEPVKPDTEGFFAYEYPSERIEQGIGFLEQIALICSSDATAVKMFEMAFFKTLHLLELESDVYREMGISLLDVLRNCRESFIEYIPQMGFEKEETVQIIKEYIDEVMEKVKVRFI